MTSGHAPPDPIAELSHDHGHLSALVIAVSGVLRDVERGARAFEEALGELEDGAESLRDALLEHFAREEEGLFPFLERCAADLGPRIERLRTEHDEVCARASAVAQAVGKRAGSEACVTAFRRFEDIYAAHAREELAFLRDADARLDPRAREELRTLLEAI